MRGTGWPTPNLVKARAVSSNESITRTPKRLLERRVVGRQQQGRVHLLQLGRAFGEIGLPGRVLRRIRARLEALLEVLVAPQVDPLVGLRELAGPSAPDRRILLASGLHFLEILAVLLRAAEVAAVDAQLINVSGGAIARLDIDHRVYQPQVLADQAGLHDRHVLLGPVLVLRQLAAQPRALLVAVVLP